MLVLEDYYFYRLGFSWPILLGLFFSLISIAIRRKWCHATERQEEIKKLMILASEESSRAELEASTEYLYGAATLPRQSQCAVCFSPTTTRCARCKAVKYCSSKCQISHWRQGHKEECSPLIFHHSTEEGNNFNQKVPRPGKHKKCAKSIETEGGHSAPAEDAFINRSTLSNASLYQNSHNVSSGRDDHTKVEFLAPVERTICTSQSSNSPFSGEFSLSSSSSESSMGAPLSKCFASYGIDNSDEPQSADSLPCTVGVTSNIKNVFQNKPQPVCEGSKHAASYKFHKVKINSRDAGKQCGYGFSSNNVNDGPRFKVSEPSQAFRGGAFDSSWSKKDDNEVSAKSNLIAAVDVDLRNSKSFLHFSFNLSGSDGSPIHSQGPHAKIMIPDNARSASLGTKSPGNGAVMPRKVNMVALGDGDIPLVDSETYDHSNNGTSPSDVLRSNEVRYRSSNVSCLETSNVPNRSHAENGKYCISKSKKEGSSFVVPDTCSFPRNEGFPVSSPETRTDGANKNCLGGLNITLKLKETVLSPGGSNACSFSGNEGPSVSSAKSGKVAGVCATNSVPYHSASNLSKNDSLITSMQKVADQVTASTFLKHHSEGAGHHDKGLFSYELFVKLYIWNKVNLCPCGLMNIGNSCYANVVLQCLAFTPPLTAYLLQRFHSKACSWKGWCFTCEFENLIVKAKEGSSPLSPIGILSQIRSIGSHLGYGREEDAHEFLRYAVDTMQSVCLKEAGVEASRPFNEQTTLIGLTFGGYLRSKIKCTRCQGKSERHESIMDLTVEIEGNINTLDAALKKFTGTEILDGENKYRCSRCKSYEKAKKKLTIFEAPNVLTIALKRFQSGKFGKLNKPIEFPEILNLAPYMSTTSDKSPIYRLYGVVVHLDLLNASYSGHYVCYVKNIQNQWFKIDDSMVKAVERERVFKRGAYMLLYSRCSPRAPRSIRNNLSRDLKNKFSPSKLTSTTTVPTVSQTNASLITSNGLPRFQSLNSRHSNQTIFESDSSDSCSLFSSCSDEGSSSTDGTRDSVSTDEFPDFIFGDSGYGWKSPWRSCDSDTSSSSSSSSPFSPLSDPGRHASASRGMGSGRALEDDGFQGSLPANRGAMKGEVSDSSFHSRGIKQCRMVDCNCSSREAKSEKLGKRTNSH